MLREQRGPERLLSQPLLGHLLHLLAELISAYISTCHVFVTFGVIDLRWAEYSLQCFTGDTFVIICLRPIKLPLCHGVWIVRIKKVHAAVNMRFISGFVNKVG